MNERIREFYNQCFVELKNDTPNVGFDFEKFARLIVRDCLKQIYYNTLMSHPEHNWSEKEIGFNEGVDAAYKKVKKHFGVEQ